MFRSIRWKLVTSYALLALVIMSMAGIIAISAITYYTQKQEDEYLLSFAESIAEQAQPYIWPMPNSYHLTRLVQSASFFGDLRVQIIDQNEKLLVDSGNPGKSDEFVWFLLPNQNLFQNSNGLPEDLIIGLLNPMEPTFFENKLFIPSGDYQDLTVTLIRRTHGPWGNRFEFEFAPDIDSRTQKPSTEPSSEVTSSRREIKVPIEADGNVFGYIIISPGADVSSQSFTFIRRSLLMAGAGSLLIAVILGLLMGKRFTDPITNLTSTSSKMSNGDLSVRAEISGNDEISKLAQQFNLMADTLENSFALLRDERDTLKRFISDASHELRTPITAIKNFNELLQNDEFDDKDLHDEFLQESERQIDRLAWITQNLLNLSRLEGGLAALDLQPQIVAEMITSAVSPHKSKAAQKNLELNTMYPSDPIEIFCDRDQFEIAISNLLDNAVKFTPEGGTINIGTERCGDYIAVWIEDTGIGIDAEDQELIFERFYKGQPNQESSSGLGLSIVKSILEAHQGQIQVESKPNAGSKFTMLWPIKKQDAQA